ncbi:PadR family transcriptional regulator [Streptomyces sp. NBC_01320]|uniref:PadR family transcriptional regulator n=1 Tax=Streptomyces sp. NBC_01320 TaxID=2903824 RepID=UPI002E11BB62|nr:PadR family transcriptional regulator [Streptomyces sp. NBC_01320]
MPERENFRIFGHTAAQYGSGHGDQIPDERGDDRQRHPQIVAGQSRPCCQDQQTCRPQPLNRIFERDRATVREFQRVAVRLHILHYAAEEEIHGAWMTEELARHGYQISPGTLYPTLHRLETDGLLVSEQQVVDGRVRRVYRATEAGKQALSEDRKALRELAREVLGDDIP